MPQVLLYADTHALASYLGGAALLEPELGDAHCELLHVRPEGDGDGAGMQALVFPPRLRLPRPGDRIAGARLQAGELDRTRGVLLLDEAQGPARYRLEGRPRGPEPLAQLLPPQPWSELPETGEVLYLCPPGEPLAQLVGQHLELGRDGLAYARVETPAGPRVLLEVPRPSWFLLEGRLEAPDPQVTVFRRLEGPLGPRRVYVEWGYRHALEAWLVEPADEALLLLIDRSGAHYRLERGQLRDIGEVLQLDPTRFPIQRLEASGPERQQRLAVHLRLEGRSLPRDPELWVLPASKRARLEELLTHTPEEELRNLLVACLEGPPGGERLYVVREVLTGRGGPRRLPLGERVYAPHPGLSSLLLPCARTLAPPLQPARYVQAFDLRPRELTLVDETPEGGLELLKLSEDAFRPIETIVDFVFDGQVAQLEAALLAAPFDLGAFAEIELEPTPPAYAAQPEPPPVDEPAPATAPAATAPPAAAASVRARRPATRPRRTASPTPGEPQPERIAELQRQVVLGAANPRAWFELGRLLFADRQPDEGLRAVENAIWTQAPEVARRTERALEEALGGPRRDPQDTLDLYRSVLAYRRRARQLSDADAYRRATERIHAVLHEQEDRLRKKSRWLLWRLILQETRDTLEAERQREAILGDLVLRGIEEREVPAYAKTLLLERYGQRAATGSGANEALSFLAACEAFAAGLGHPAFRAEALADVAWALAELGQGERALNVAEAAEREAKSPEGAPPRVSQRARALARVGAVHERVVGRGRGEQYLEQSLQSIATSFGQEARSSAASHLADARKALRRWFHALAEARGTDEARGAGGLLRRALGLLESRPPNEQSQVIYEESASLVRLGAGPRLQRLLRGLIDAEPLRVARRAIRDSGLSDDAYCIHVQNVLACLDRLSAPAPLGEDDARRVLELMREDPRLIDEFSVRPLLVGLRGAGGAPWQVAREVAEQLEAQELPYEAQLVGLAGLTRLAELRERERGPQHLQQALEQAWGLSDPFQRTRVLTRLIELVPAFGLRERGLEILRETKRRLGEELDEVYHRNEHLVALSVASSKLGDSRASFELIEDITATARAAYQRQASEDKGWLLFETLEACADGSVDLGEGRRGLKLVVGIGELAEQTCEQTQAQVPAQYFFFRLLLRCGRAAFALGDSAAADRFFDAFFDRLDRLSRFDRFSLLTDVAVDVVGELEGARRYALAGRIVEAAAAIASGASGRESFGVDLVRNLTRTMVSGESAYAAALKRWKGREEREVRERVAHEQIT